MSIVNQSSNENRLSPAQLVFRRYLAVAIAFTVVASTIAIGVVSEVPSASALSSGTVSGTVYHDFNGDGNKNNASLPFGADAGLENVTVRAYDSAGAMVGQATSSANGTYSISVVNAATSDVRIEFDTPAGFFPSPTDINFPASPFTGAAKSSRPGPIQFTVVPSTNVNYALVNDVVKATDKIAAVQMRQGASNLASSVDSIWLTDQTLSPVYPNIANSGETGALWGLAWNRTNQRLWSSAVIRRTAGLGPKGIGGLYMVDTTGSTGTNVIASFDLRDYGLVLENVTTSGGTDYEDAERDITGTSRIVYWDIPGYNGVGLEGIGDIDFTKDDRYLYVVNLYERKIHRFAVGGSASAPTLTERTDFQVPDTHCTSPNIARPWGIEVMEDGTLNVGAVCTSLVSGTAALTARPDPEKGSILRLDPSSGAWSEVGTVDFGYFRATHNAYFGNDAASTAVMRDTTSHWQEWTNDWATIDAIGGNPWNYFDWAQPIISDIETVKGGGLFVGITDRFGFQATEQLAAPDPTRTTTKVWNYQVSTSETIYMCKSATSFVQDIDAACKNNPSWVRDTYLHAESSLGALAAYDPSITQWVASTAMDPGAAYTAGVWQNNVDTGTLNAGTAYQANDFSKGAAMGDIEVLTQYVPLSIGNRLWFDTDADGIQDPGEPPVVGATVRLYDSTGTLRGTVQTNANGEYYFSSDHPEAATGNGDHLGGGVTAGDAYTVRVDRPQDFTAGSLLAGYALTAADRTSATSAMDDEIDSDATLVSGYPRIAVPAMEWGTTNVSYDIGFAPVVSVGDRVWVDTDRDRVQDAGEVGLAGVTVSITKADGSPVYDVAGNLVTSVVTDANGNYLFANLPTAPAGGYKTSIAVPAGYAATTSTQMSSASLTTAGASDLTLDFGIVPVVSVGNLVWNDLDRDGVQDVGEPGIAGATLTITKADGSAVTDVNGTAVTTTTTDANGNYVFANLPPGSYKVSATTPAGFISTVSGAGTPGTDSSTGNATSAVLAGGQSDMTLDFGFFTPVVSVGDLVWKDLDRDGVQDAGEPGIAGVTLTITKADGSPVIDINGTAVTTTTTDANGNYVFANLPSGSYKVTVTDPAGYAPTVTGSGTTLTDSSTGNATSSNLTLDGSSDLSLDFGFVTPAVSVGNLVWKDLDRDGVQDVGEPGVAGVTVTITKADGSPVTDINGTVVSTTTTDANGNYSFANLPVGQYKVTVATPTGMAPTLTGAGTPATDSSTGNATSANLTTNGASDTTLDFGFVDLPVTVGNLVWNDLDRDGVQDVGEPGIAGATLTITKADGSAVTDVNGTAVTTTTTDANGNYSFANLPVGQYKVTVATPTGMASTLTGAGTPGTDSSTGNAMSAVLVGGQSDSTLDFGFFTPVVSVGDLVWFDTDRDGIQDAGELGIAGVTLSITKADGSAVSDVNGNPVTTTTTDANGNYRFLNLPVGSYKVTVTDPAGYAPTVTGAGAAATDSSTGNATSMNLTVDGASDTSLDFGFYSPVVSVGDLVWFDTDHDGIQDAGEPGLSGVAVTITKADGSPVTDINGAMVSTTTTDANGNYSFANLPVGQYKVTVATPAGMTATVSGAGTTGTDSSTGNATSANLTVDGQADTSLDFGFWAPPAVVGSLVWSDLDGDGIQDAGEPGIAGVTLRLTDTAGNPVTDVDGNLVSNVTTDANGNYLFVGLPLNAAYKVSVVTAPVGYITSPAGVGSDRAVDSSAGTATSTQMTVSNLLDLTLDFGFVPMVSVGDLVWLDANRNGVQDAGEGGIAGVTLSITKADGSAVTDVNGAAVSTTTTDTNGNYIFANLPVGSYKVTVADPAGYAPTVSGAGTAATDSSTGNATSASLMTGGARDATLDFGYVTPAVSVGNLVWYDLDRDGVQDAGERGIAGVTLSITKPDGSAVTDVNGTAVTTTTTDANGNYVFANLPLGQYKVTVTTPAGMTATVSGAGTTGTDSSTGNATSANLTADGQADTTLDFGFFGPRVSVGNLAWIDTNGNGIQDQGEPGIEGATLTLTDMNGDPVIDVVGNLVAPFITDATGRFLFANLPLGQYKVHIAPPAGYVSTISGAGDLMSDSAIGFDTSRLLSADGDADMTLDFGFEPAPTPEPVASEPPPESEPLMPSRLPQTGIDFVAWFLWALLLVGAGSVLTKLGRRNHNGRP